MPPIWGNRDLKFFCFERAGSGIKVAGDVTAVSDDAIERNSTDYLEEHVGGDNAHFATLMWCSCPRWMVHQTIARWTPMRPTVMNIQRQLRRSIRNVQRVVAQDSKPRIARGPVRSDAGARVLPYCADRR